EHTDLGNVRPSRNMNQVLFTVGVEFICPRKVMQCTVNLLEIPRVAEFNFGYSGAGFRGASGDIAGDLFSEAKEFSLIQELNSLDQQVFVLAEGDSRAPALPSVRPLASIKRRAQQPYNNIISEFHYTML